MSHVLMIAEESQALGGLLDGLMQSGFTCSTASYDEEVTELLTRQQQDVILVEINGNLPDSGRWDFIHRLKEESTVPVIALLAAQTLEGINGQLETDDFLTSPYDVKELLLRAKRLFSKTKGVDGRELIKCDEMVIDVGRCEVTIEDEVVDLTFREYELLKFLAVNKGRVYTREVLLNKVWGYDYYGGDRTVDTHIRRLRSKTEGPHNDFIETVRNVGYRFRKDN